nr:MAG TPA: hypothetical protein [Caudoviricetes sp.]
MCYPHLCGRIQLYPKIYCHITKHRCTLRFRPTFTL